MVLSLHSQKTLHGFVASQVEKVIPEFCNIKTTIELNEIYSLMNNHYISGINLLAQHFTLSRIMSIKYP